MQKCGMSRPHPDPDAPAHEAGLTLLSPHAWRRRLVLWIGAVLVALAALLFAKASDYAFGLFQQVIAHSSLWALLLTPAMFALLAFASGGRLQATRGSGIQQVIAALERPLRTDFRAGNLSLTVAAAKLGLTTLGLAGGASIGREGPTVHVGAAIMHALGKRFGHADPLAASRYLLAGGAAGLAAAFNTPLAGVVFAIEELASGYEARMSGTLLSAVIIGGVVSLGLVGSYSYFGSVAASLALGSGWLAVLACGVLGGLLGGGFARVIAEVMGGRPRWFGRVRARHPVLLAGLFGLLLVLLGLWLGEGMFGTGYAQARSLVQGHATVGHEFGLGKLVANLLSYLAGIPGGLFSPALAVGAGLGHNLTLLLPEVDPRTLVLLGMCGYLAGVTQAPLTSAIIAMEMTDNNTLLLPILATVLVARGASALLCHTPIYKALAEQLVAAMDRDTSSTNAATDTTPEPRTP